jgi:hypothetical protein
MYASAGVAFLAGFIAFIALPAKSQQQQQQPAPA